MVTTDGRLEYLERTDIKEVAAAAAEGFARRLNDGANFTRIGVVIYGENMWIDFEDDFTGRTLMKVRQKPEFDVRIELYIPTETAASLLRNLTVDEIEDYIRKVKDGENPEITDYVEEVV